MTIKICVTICLHMHAQNDEFISNDTLL